MLAAGQQQQPFADDTAYWTHIRALNHHFLEQCKSLLAREPLADLRAACKSMLSLRDSIDGKKPSAPVSFSFTQASTASTNPANTTTTTTAIKPTSRKRGKEDSDDEDADYERVAAKKPATLPSAPSIASFGSAKPASLPGAFAPAPSAASSDAPKPAFTFPALAPASADAASTFKAAPKPSFSFGGGTSGSTFVFGAPAATAATPAAPAAPPSTTSSSGFVFKPSEPSAFSFKPATADTTPPKPAFSFGGLSATPAPTFGSTATTASSAAKTEPATAEPAGDEDEDAAPKYETNPELTRSGAGEEEEQTVHEVRSSLSVLRHSEGTADWEKLGVGTLKINVPATGSTSSKPRLLMRLDGNGRVALNTLLKTAVLGKVTGKRVDFAVPTNDGKLMQHAALVKTPDLAKQLHEAIQKYKSEAQ
ncbi:hypothetical protein RI367_002601 [Sorochytrium milnesiophthora]